MSNFVPPESKIYENLPDESICHEKELRISVINENNSEFKKEWPHLKLLSMKRKKWRKWWTTFLRKYIPL